MFDLLIEPLRVVARALGYTLAVHGSLRRDIDLIAVPWIESAAAPDELAAAIRGAAHAITGCAFWLDDPTARPSDYTRRFPEPKPHGRLGWSIHIGGYGTYIDLSILTPSTWPAHREALAKAQREGYSAGLRDGLGRYRYQHVDHGEQ